MKAIVTITLFVSNSTIASGSDHDDNSTREALDNRAACGAVTPKFECYKVLREIGEEATICVD